MEDDQGKNLMDLYEAIYSRRDIRDFRPDPVPVAVLRRILDAAHHAGSVGLMQPWNFLILRSIEIRRRVHEVFQAENARAAERYTGDRRALYDSLKLQGILDSPLNLVVTCNRDQKGPHVLGRNSIRDSDIYSTCCAVQNLWLAARAEGVGVGWVSILDSAAIAEILGLPEGVMLVAYLCVGYPVEFADRPLLERVGWEKRIPLEDLVFEDMWGHRPLARPEGFDSLDASGEKIDKKTEDPGS
jgi:5,6-dimethylbenzimidazole synthase